MAAIITQEKMQYIFALQAAAKAVLTLNMTLTNLNNAYLGGGLSGQFLDSDCAGNTNTQHMVAADIGTFTTNMNTISTALSSGVVQNMAKCVGIPLG